MKVLVLALDSFGDLVLRQPLLSGLLDDGHEVGVVVRSGFERVLPLLDPRLVAHAVPFGYTALPAVAEACKALDELAALQPDLVVDAQFDSVVYAEWIRRRLSSVRVIGFGGGVSQAVAGARAWEHELDLPPARPLDLAVGCDPALPDLDKNARLFEAIAGHPPLALRPRLSLPEALLDRGRAELALRGLSPGSYVACCPAGTANVRLKAWQPERFASLVAWLARERGVPSLVLGHRAEAPIVETVLELAKDAKAQSFLGRDQDFELMVSLLAQARLYLGNDTGPMHLAAASGVPVVAIFGGGHWPRFLPATTRGAVHTQQLPCFGCGWRDCVFGDAPCVARVEEAQVRGSITRILDGGDGFEIVAQPPLPEGELEAKAVAGFRAVSDESARRLDEVLARDVAIGHLQGHIRNYENHIRDYAAQAEAREVVIRDYAAHAHAREVVIRDQQADIVRLDLTARHAPLVSVVTPTFNAERWLERCILSVREQDYPKIEHIIVDGGSSDATLAICARYPHLVVHSAPDRGQSDALNRGFAMCRGEVLAWLCGDDEYMPQAVSTAVDAIVDGHDFVVGNCHFIDAEGRLLSGHPTNVRSVIHHETLVRFWRATLPQPATFWRRRLWDRCGPLREDLHFTMDYDLWLRMSRVAQVHRVPLELAAYRIHPDAKCFADNYGSRLELLEVSRRSWPPVWHPGHWRLALEHWLSGKDITPHFTEAERLRDRAFRKLSEKRRLQALTAFVKMHALHPRSPALRDYRRLARKLAASFVPDPLRPLANAALGRFRRRARPAA